jgi:hypothetical protein
MASQPGRSNLSPTISMAKSSVKGQGPAFGEVITDKISKKNNKKRLILTKKSPVAFWRQGIRKK